MFLGIDPIYLIIAGVTMAISLGAASLVKVTFAKYRRVGNSRNMTGAEAARAMLAAEGVNDVTIQRYGGGFLSDHFDPSTKIINLSPEVYDGRSVAAVGVACHEAGHALQHAQGYAMLRLRSALVPITNIGSRVGVPIMIVGAMLGVLGLAKIGFYLFATVFFFQLVTLPVEWNASTRSKQALVHGGVVAPGAEARGVYSVLNAAALTYLAGAITSLLYLLYYAYRLGLFGGRSRD